MKVRNVVWPYADRLWWEMTLDRAHFFRWHRLLGWPESAP